MTWVKGKSGNPHGRPPAERPFLTALNMEILAAGSDQRALRKIARKLIEMATEGDIQAITVLADRLDGKPKQQLDLAVAVVSHEDRLEELRSYEEEHNVIDGQIVLPNGHS